MKATGQFRMANGIAIHILEVVVIGRLSASVPYTCQLSCYDIKVPLVNIPPMCRAAGEGEKAGMEVERWWGIFFFNLLIF